MRLGGLDPRKACDESPSSCKAHAPGMALPRGQLAARRVPTTIKELYGRSGFELIVSDRVASGLLSWLG